MKILFVTPRLPLPADTGAKIRTFNLLKHIAKENRVSLLSFYFEENQKAVEGLKSMGIEVFLVKAKEDINPLSIFSRKPISIEKYNLKEMEVKIKELVNSGGFDLVHFDHLHIGQYRDCINGLPCVLDEHNVEAVILDRCAEIEKNSVKRFLFRSQAKKTAFFEAGLTRQFSKCLTVSEKDRQNLSKLSGVRENIEVVPNGVDTEYFRPRDEGRGTREVNSLVFTGSMDWLPNSDAVIYFCNEILPLIWDKKSNVRFYVVGKNPTKDVVNLGRQDNRVVVTGSVGDVRPYIAKAKVFVAPIRIGGGTRLKILEAMAMEKPVVSTTIGAEGIDCTKDINILLADNPQDFADKVISLADDSHKTHAIGQSGRRLVCEEYDWSIAAKKLNKVYRDITDVK